MRNSLHSLYIFVASLVLFVIGIHTPSRPVFDEAHYIPAAGKILALENNGNYEHPPLAKELMAVGIALTGEDLFGARLMSAIFAALACVAFFQLARLYLASHEAALFALILVWLNGMTLVLARLAMLEIFSVTFTLFAVLFFVRQRDLFSALCIGAAIACKWNALLPWILLLLAALYQHRRWPKLLLLVCAPVFLYALTYVPLAQVDGPEFSLRALLQMQSAMWHAQTLIIPRHSEFSPWWAWPLKLQPMWLMRDFTDYGSHSEVQSVILWGNPFVVGLGFFALVMQAVQKRFLLVGIYLALLLPWIVIPRANMFYYYYFPMSWVVTLALAAWLKANWTSGPRRILVWGTVAASAVFFLYHWPLMTGWNLDLNEAQFYYPYLF